MLPYHKSRIHLRQFTHTTILAGHFMLVDLCSFPFECKEEVLRRVHKYLHEADFTKEKKKARVLRKTHPDKHSEALKIALFIVVILLRDTKL